MRNTIERMLWNLGAHPDRRGYEQAIRVLLLMQEQQSEWNISHIYEQSANEQNIRSTNVEKSIRDLIRSIWCYNSTLPNYFIERGYGKQNPPSAKAFLFTLLTYMHIQQNNE